MCVWGLAAEYLHEMIAASPRRAPSSLWRGKLHVESVSDVRTKKPWEFSLWGQVEVLIQAPSWGSGSRGPKDDHTTQPNSLDAGFFPLYSTKATYTVGCCKKRVINFRLFKDNNVNGLCQHTAHSKRTSPRRYQGFFHGESQERSYSEKGLF